MSAHRFVCLGVTLAVAAFATLAFQARAEDKPATQPAGFTGTWKWEQPGRGGNNAEVVLKLKQDADKLAGTITGFGGDESPIQDGKVTDGKITFKVVREFGGNQVTTNYTATLSDGALKGKSETIFARDFEGKRDGQ